jgi:hypothetical protein
MNFLTDQERAQLKSQHKQERDGRVRDRIKAILLYDGKREINPSFQDGAFVL